MQSIDFQQLIFSNDPADGVRPLQAVNGGTWFGSRLASGGQHALMGVSMAPGFNPADYEIGSRDTLPKQFPEQKDLVIAFTREQETFVWDTSPAGLR